MIKESRRGVSKGQELAWKNASPEKRLARIRKNSKKVREARKKITPELEKEHNKKRSATAKKYWESRTKEQMKEFSKKMSKVRLQKLYKDVDFVKVPIEKVDKVHGVIVSDD